MKVLQKTGLLHKAEEIRDKHRLLLSAYGKCYKGYSAAKVLTQQDIATLGMFTAISHV